MKTLFELYRRKYMVFGLVNLALFALLLFWSVTTSVTSHHQYHLEIAHESTATVANTIGHYIRERRRLVGLFARHHQEIIQAFVDDPENETLYHKLEQNVAEFFPTSFAFTVADQDGTPYRVDIDGHISQRCELDIKRFAVEGQHHAYIHPNPNAYHFDIMQTMTLKQGNAVFFVSFHADHLGTILKAAQAPEHDLILIYVNDSVLLEVTSQGARNRVPRDDYRLTALEQSRFLSTTPVPGSHWLVADMHNEQLFSHIVYQQYLSAIAMFLLVASITFFMIRRIHKEHDCTLQVQTLLLQSQQQLEQTVELRTKELQQTVDELAEYSRSIAHDLRTPVRAITSFSQIVFQDAHNNLDQESKENLQRIIRAGIKMSVLIDDILRLSNVTRTPLSSTKINLTVLARDIAKKLQLPDGENQVEVHIEDGLMIRGDYKLLKTAIYQLLDNAFRFSRYTGKAKVELGKFIKDGKTVIFVRDNGPGIDARYIKKIFQPFEKLHDEPDHDGSGIGLAMVSRIVSRHHGKTWVKSTVAHGTSFYFMLPE